VWVCVCVCVCVCLCVYVCVYVSTCRDGVSSRLYLWVFTALFDFLVLQKVETPQLSNLE